MKNLIFYFYNLFTALASNKFYASLLSFFFILALFNTSHSSNALFFCFLTFYFLFFVLFFFYNKIWPLLVSQQQKQFLVFFLKKNLEKNKGFKKFHSSSSIFMFGVARDAFKTVVTKIITNPNIEAKAVDSGVKAVSSIQNLSTTQVAVISSAAVGLAGMVEYVTHKEEITVEEKRVHVLKEEIVDLEKKGFPCAAEVKTLQLNQTQKIFERSKFHGYITNFLSSRFDFRGRDLSEIDAIEGRVFADQIEESQKRAEEERESWRKKESKIAEEREEAANKLARKYALSQLPYHQWIWAHIQMIYEQPVVKSGIHLLFNQLTAILLEKGSEAARNSFKESLNRGVVSRSNEYRSNFNSSGGSDDGGSSMIGSPFEERHGYVSQTYNLLLLTYTSFQDYMDKNIEELKVIHGDDLTPEILTLFFSLHPFADSEEYAMILKYLKQDEMLHTEKKESEDNYKTEDGKRVYTSDWPNYDPRDFQGDPGQGSSADNGPSYPDSPKERVPLHRTDNIDDLSRLQALNKSKFEFQNGTFDPVLDQILDPDLRQRLIEADAWEKQIRKENKQNLLDSKSQKDLIKSTPFYEDTKEKKDKEKKD